MFGVGCSEPSVTFGYFRILRGWFCEESIFVHRTVIETSKA
jgi:hypothetical protein